MKRGFTLLELVTVVITISVLATLGFVQYKKAIENARSGEAKMILSTLRKAESMYQLQNQSYASNLAALDLGSELASCSGQTSSYFSFACDSNGTCTASRCTSGGKFPPVPVASAYSISLTVNGTLSQQMGVGSIPTIPIPGGASDTAHLDVGARSSDSTSSTSTSRSGGPLR